MLEALNEPMTMRMGETAMDSDLDVSERAKRMIEVRGIEFAKDYSGWHACVAGAGLEVREVIKIYKECDENWDALKIALYWWTDVQLKTALTYYQRYPEEIEEYLRSEAEFEEEARRQGYPTITARPES
jgi:uncharacterized protein (DUF433 family)